jgi:hypothetical protein
MSRRRQKSPCYNRKIHTGPQGGKYCNKNGYKVYVSKIRSRSRSKRRKSPVFIYTDYTEPVIMNQPVKQYPQTFYYNSDNNTEQLRNCEQKNKKLENELTDLKSKYNSLDLLHQKCIEQIKKIENDYMTKFQQLNDKYNSKANYCRSEEEFKDMYSDYENRVKIVEEKYEKELIKLNDVLVECEKEKQQIKKEYELLQKKYKDDLEQAKRDCDKRVQSELERAEKDCDERVKSRYISKEEHNRELDQLKRNYKCSDTDNEQLKKDLSIKDIELERVKSLTSVLDKHIVELEKHIDNIYNKSKTDNTEDEAKDIEEKINVINRKVSNKHIQDLLIQLKICKEELKKHRQDLDNCVKQSKDCEEELMKYKNKEKEEQNRRGRRASKDLDKAAELNVYESVPLSPLYSPSEKQLKDELSLCELNYTTLHTECHNLLTDLNKFILNIDKNISQLANYNKSFERLSQFVNNSKLVPVNEYGYIYNDMQATLKYLSELNLFSEQIKSYEWQIEQLKNFNYLDNDKPILELSR